MTNLHRTARPRPRKDDDDHHATATLRAAGGSVTHMSLAAQNVRQAEVTVSPMEHVLHEVDDAPGEPKGTPWHPHRGFETVTYMLDGVFQHQDSNGGGLITDGDTQWMTAGAGLLFSQRG
jgi:redox-sensitive bicupin YhaK (pirin superfamily)